MNSISKPNFVDISKQPPILRAPEKVDHIYKVIIAAACLPAFAGFAYFGYHAIFTIISAVISCMFFDWSIAKLANSTKQFNKIYSALTGLLFALTLPAFCPWWVVIVGAAFAITIGKFGLGGIGNMVWQPALVGRFAVAMIIPFLASQETINPINWPILTKQNVFLGDIDNSQTVNNYTSWDKNYHISIKSAISIKPISERFKSLTQGKKREYSSLATVSKNFTQKQPALLGKLPPINELMWGARPGSIGETCIIFILLAGLYLCYRNYVNLALPATFIISAWLIAGLMPIHFAGPSASQTTLTYPLFNAPFGVGFTYANYRILTGSFFLCAFFFLPDMSCRPITAGGQVIFGIFAGALAMLSTLYLPTTIPVYIALLVASTFSPLIDKIWQPRVFGQ